MSERIRNGEEESIRNGGFKINLTTDSMRWDSLKIDSSTEFEQNILQKFPSASFEALQQWHPIELLLHDVDTDEYYSVNLKKKESFWFEPLPDVGSKKEKTMERCVSGLKEFAYCLEPFRHIIKKRSLSYDHHIGLVVDH
ncbi:hypothetical protein M5689_023940 [Euphorbia peplus]|nr:hypothetical protein M5689_023938 [Euphorbia peplus]WCJ43180.1 hypothetical protein M5689_023940 [Euphorbia peplus]